MIKFIASSEVDHELDEALLMVSLKLNCPWGERSIVHGELGMERVGSLRGGLSLSLSWRRRRGLLRRGSFILRV